MQTLIPDSFNKRYNTPAIFPDKNLLRYRKARFGGSQGDPELIPTTYILKGASSVQSETANTRLLLLALMTLSFVLLGSNATAQQSIEDNVRPAGQVCLEGQPCVGSTADRASPATSVSLARAAVPTKAVIEEVVEEEIEAVAEVVAFDVESTYQMSCFACHGTGAAGAPLLGDVDAWAERMAKGMEAVMVNVVNGVNAMPPKGLCMTCSDDNLQELVNYMISH